MGGVIELKDAWLLCVLHVEYERLKKTNAIRSIVLASVEDLNGYMIELIERNK